jgi:selenoprotein W-related protein
VSLLQTLLSKAEDKIESINLFPSNGGRFEVVINGLLIYSKLETGRHTSADEILRLMQENNLL